MNKLLVFLRYTATLFISLDLIGQTLQSPRGFYEKRFNIEAVPTKNGKILLHLKGRYGAIGADGPMGDQGLAGIPGPPGTMGEKGTPGICSLHLCIAMQQAKSLLLRVTKLEKLVASRAGLVRDQPVTWSADNSIVAVHITSDILLSKTNLSQNGSSNGGGLPRNINLNIALKNGVVKQDNSLPSVSASGHGRKFMINSTVFLEQKSGIAKAPDGRETMATERQSEQEEVPSIKKSRILHQQKPWTDFLGGQNLGSYTK